MQHCKQAVAATSKSVSASGGASLFKSFKTSVDGALGDSLLNLSEEALVKGGAAGIIQHLLEEVVEKALALYPPP